MRTHPNIVGTPGAAQVWFKRLTKQEITEYLRKDANARVMRFITGRPRIGREATSRFFTKLKNYNDPTYAGGDWYIMHGQKIAGSIALVKIPGTTDWQIGYALHPNFFGLGIATLAGSLMLKLAFGYYHHQKLYGLTFPHNVASQRVLAKLGFRPRGQRYVEAYGDISDQFMLTRQQYFEGLIKRK